LPALANAWDGFFTVLVPPSPNFQDQETGFPVLVSANCTTCPGPGVGGLKTNDAAASVGRTVSVFEAFRVLAVFDTVRVTRRNPGEA
jgi:hypothetical protein